MIAVIVAVLLLGAWWYVEKKSVRLSPTLKREMREYIVGIDSLPSRVERGDVEYIKRIATDSEAKWKAIALALPEGPLKYKGATAELALGYLELMDPRIKEAWYYWDDQTKGYIENDIARAKSHIQAAKTELADTLKD